MEFAIALWTELRKQELIIEFKKLLIETNKICPINYPHKVIIPSNFIEKSNELKEIPKSNIVKSEAENINPPMGETFFVEDGFIILISPSLCENDNFWCQREHTFLHEIYHGNSEIASRHNDLLYYLFDDYCAERFAYQIGNNVIASIDSLRWEKYIILEFRKRLDEIAKIDSELIKIFIRQNLIVMTDEFGSNLISLFTSITMLFATYDQYKSKFQCTELSKTPIYDTVNNLMEFFKNKFDLNDNDLSDGCIKIDSLITNYSEYLELRFK